MPVKGVKHLCGAKCRTKGGAPCEMPATKGSGFTRCRMHGGCHFKNKTHGRMTIRALEEKKRDRKLLKEMKAVTREIQEKETRVSSP